MCTWITRPIPQPYSKVGGKSKVLGTCPSACRTHGRMDGRTDRGSIWRRFESPETRDRGWTLDAPHHSLTQSSRSISAMRIIPECAHWRSRSGSHSKFSNIRRPRKAPIRLLFPRLILSQLLLLRQWAGDIDGVDMRPSHWEEFQWFNWPQQSYFRKTTFSFLPSSPSAWPIRCHI